MNTLKTIIVCFVAIKVCKLVSTLFSWIFEHPDNFAIVFTAFVQSGMWLSFLVLTIALTGILLFLKKFCYLGDEAEE